MITMREFIAESQAISKKQQAKTCVFCQTIHAGGMIEQCKTVVTNTERKIA